MAHPRGESRRWISGIRRWSVTAALLFTVSVAMNLAWEVGQSRFFAPMGATLLDGLLRCFRASLGDGLIVLTIAVAGAAALGRPDWFLDPRKSGYVFTVVLGAGIAVGVEWVGLRLGRWVYRASMPLLPVVRVGLLPVLEMAFLPPLIFLIVRRLSGRGVQKTP